MAGLEVLLSLSLESSVRLHQIVVKFDQLLHLLERITGHFGLILHFMLHGLLLGILVPSHEGLILPRQQHDSLLILHLRFDKFFIQGVNLLPLQIEIDSDQVDKLLNRINLRILMRLLRADHLLKLATQVTCRLKLLS